MTLPTTTNPIKLDQSEGRQLPRSLTRIACWLSRGDNAFGVLVISTAPLFALAFIGMAGAP